MQLAPTLAAPLVGLVVGQPGTPVMSLNAPPPAGACCQRIWGSGRPVATAFRLAVWPASTSWSSGWVLKVGGVLMALTLSVAMLEVTQREAPAHTCT